MPDNQQEETKYQRGALSEGHFHVGENSCLDENDGRPEIIGKVDGDGDK